MAPSVLDVLLLDAVHDWFVEERQALLLRLGGIALKILGMIHSSRIEGSNSLTESQLITRVAPADATYLRSVLSFLGTCVDRGLSSHAVKELYEDGPKVINVTAFQFVSANSVDERLVRLRASSRLANVSRALCPPAWLIAEAAQHDLSSSEVGAEHDLTPCKVERSDAKRRRVLRRDSSSVSSSLLKPPPRIAGHESHGAAATFVDDPHDARLSAAGASVAGGKVELRAYTDLKAHFAVEPESEGHPDPQKPGMRRHELSGAHAVSLEGLRPWSDGKGKGWMVLHRLPCGKMQSRYMSAITWGSWRLAFLLARLQRDVWV